MARSRLGLMIGNSRLHWAWFEDDRIQLYDLPHLPASQIACLTQQLDFAACNLAWPKATPPPGLPLCLASVIPAQTRLWQTYAATQTLTLDQIPLTGLLTGLYPTLGIDRALALLGAVRSYGSPSLVIDAGTALTFTGADAQGQLLGGAILPGLRLQLRALGDHTAALPQLAAQTPQLPERWGRSTTDAIWSGVLYGLLASLREFVMAWQVQQPHSSILLTGGDAALLHELLHQQPANWATQIQLDPQLLFRGMGYLSRSSQDYSGE